MPHNLSHLKAFSNKEFRGFLIFFFTGIKLFLRNKETRKNNIYCLHTFIYY